jgi:hypothetical protein
MALALFGLWFLAILNGHPALHRCYEKFLFPDIKNGNEFALWCIKITHLARQKMSV